MTKTLSAIALAAVAYMSYVKLRKPAKENTSNADARAVTKTANAGQAQTKVILTSPINRSRVAFVAPSSFERNTANVPRPYTDPISTSIPARTDALQAFGNPRIAAAAISKVTVASNYRVTPYAGIK